MPLKIKIIPRQSVVILHTLSNQYSSCIAKKMQTHPKTIATRPVLFNLFDLRTQLAIIQIIGLIKIKIDKKINRKK